MTGINATYAIIRAAILPILSDNPVFWKKIPKLITPNNHNGTKIVNNVTSGNLYKGI
jgi:hypothetical protein